MILLNSSSSTDKTMPHCNQKTLFAIKTFTPFTQILNLACLKQNGIAKMLTPMMLLAKVTT
jgi:hypothetical protein